MMADTFQYASIFYFLIYWAWCCFE